MRFRSTVGRAAAALVLAVPAARSAGAQGYQITLFSAPVPTGTTYPVTTLPGGINGAGQVSGYTRVQYPSYSGIGGSFVYGGGAFTAVQDPGGGVTIARGIGGGGAVVGTYADQTVGGYRGFVYSAGTFQALTLPGGAGQAAFETNPYGINDLGQIVGTYTGADGLVHGFLSQGGAYTSFDAFGAYTTNYFQPLAVSNAGVIAGTYLDASYRSKGFLRDANGNLTTLSAPGADETYVRGINSAGVVVGYGFSNTTYLSTPFLYQNGVFTTFSLGAVAGVPAATPSLAGINDAGQIVGSYGGYGFIAAPLATAVPEPSALALAGVGLAAVGALARGRRGAR